MHEQFIEDLSAKCNVGDYVGIKIDKVDRTNTDSKILASVTIEKKQNKIKVVCEYGAISQWWSMDYIVQLSAVLETLVNLERTKLKEISFITASRYFTRGDINGVTCSCKGGCRTKQYTCRKKHILFDKMSQVWFLLYEFRVRKSTTLKYPHVLSFLRI